MSCWRAYSVNHCTEVETPTAQYELGGNGALSMQCEKKDIAESCSSRGWGSNTIWIEYTWVCGSSWLVPTVGMLPGTKAGERCRAVTGGTRLVWRSPVMVEIKRTMTESEGHTGGTEFNWEACTLDRYRLWCIRWSAAAEQAQNDPCTASQNS